MRILILNWRDIKNPSSGGAEILTHEIAKYLVQKKNKVTIFSSLFEGAKKEEVIDGIRIIRQGQSIARYFFNSVHFLAFRKYKSTFENNIDIVIDEIHGLPFFTPWYVSEKKIALVCEVAGDLWKKMFGVILGTVGRFTEIMYLRHIYKSTPFITISESAKTDLIRNGVNSKNISVIPVGVHIPKNLPMIQREKKPTVIFLGRVAKSKGIEDAILAIQEIARYTEIVLWIVGRGDDHYVAELKLFINKLGLKNKVIFYGYVSEEKKFDLLSRAWVLVHPSKTEGWGINVIEANSMGVPAVAYGVPGLKDSIQDNRTGLLVSEMTVDGLTAKLKELLEDTKLYSRLSQESKKWAKGFTWEKSGERMWDILQNL